MHACRSTLEDPTASAVAVDGDDVFGTFHRNSGLVAWHRPGADPVWHVDSPTAQAIDAGLVIDDAHVYAGNGNGTMTAYDRKTGALVWSTQTVAANDWSYALAGTPALSDGRLFVPTQWGDLVALDVADGHVLWRYRARLGPLRTAATRGRQAGFQSSPAVMGDTVWAADTSGLVVALDARTGAPRMQIDLATPVLGGLTVAGDTLLVPAWDGTVHAIRAADAPPAPTPNRKRSLRWLWAIPLPIGAIALFLLLRKRR